MNSNLQRMPSVFVMMPFKDKFDNVFEKGIRSACVDEGVKCARLDKEIIPNRITEEMYNQIDRSDILIADVTGLNANVYYEIGFSHGIGKNVIFIKSSDDRNDFLFDIKDLQHIVYTDVDHLKAELRRRLQSYIEHPEKNIWGSDFHNSRLQRYVPKTYQDFTKASVPLHGIIKDYLQNSSKVNIKLMGMALHKSFPLIKDLIEDDYLVKENDELSLSLELAVVSEKWLKQYDGLIHSDWTERLNIFNIQYKDFEQKSKGRFSTILYRFHHLPYVHGVLINDNNLFLGSASWDRHQKFIVGGNEYEEYDGESNVGDRKIHQFIGWFNYCKQEHEFFNS